MKEVFNAPDDNDSPNYVYSTADENGGHSYDRDSSVYVELDEVAVGDSGLLHVCFICLISFFSAGNSDFVPKSVCTRGEEA